MAIKRSRDREGGFTLSAKEKKGRRALYVWPLLFGGGLFCSFFFGLIGRKDLAKKVIVRTREKKKVSLIEKIGIGFFSCVARPPRPKKEASQRYFKGRPRIHS